MTSEQGLPMTQQWLDLAVVIEDPIHRSDRAVIYALVKQGRIDLGWRLIGETWRVQHVQHDLLL